MRAAALALASMVLLASSAGSVHDPRCPLHEGGSGLLHVVHGPTHQDVDHGSDESHAHAPTECTCDGGLCVRVVVMHPVLASATQVAVDAGWAVEDAPATIVELPSRSDRALQPPGTGPPTLV